MESIIELDRVRILQQDFEVLKEISLRFPRGRSTVIMGPAGCGKSTLLKVAAGILIPESGRVLLDGEDMFHLSEKRMILFRRQNGFVFQDAALWGNQTIYDNLALPVRFHEPQLDAAEVRHRVMESLERLEMDGQAPLRPAQLSAGERKLVSFLRGVILEPTLIFLDEPTSSIDHAMLERMMAMIRRQKERECTIIAVTHDATLTSMIADHLVVMKEGQILEEGEFETVRRSGDPQVIAILSEVLSKAASYDTDLLDLLDG
jgi:phospholipid/cholesterol/gamma-HCH transport system ATP-binding protein